MVNRRRLENAIIAMWHGGTLLLLKGVNPLSLRGSIAFESVLGWVGLTRPVLEAVNHTNVYHMKLR